ncbi:MAG: lysyl-tRNA synthetase, class, partial [Euryarchaeota archaeon]|nr:lysyl-tRNA synthetase, class [Euryarchaeota archaeon]
MTMEINNTDLSENMLPEDSSLSGSRAFDDSKLAKLNGIINQGLNPYPYRFEKNGDICEILEKFEDFEKNEGLTVRTAGRLYNIRRLGKM